MAEKRKFKVSAERLVIFGLLIVLTFTVAGFAIASAATKIPAGNGLVRFCRNNTNGNARIVLPSVACATTEQKVQMRSYDPIGVRFNGSTSTFLVNHHATNLTRLSAGVYQLTFDRDITGCVATAAAYAMDDDAVGVLVAGAGGVGSNQLKMTTETTSTNTLEDTTVSLSLDC